MRGSKVLIDIDSILGTDYWSTKGNFQKYFNTDFLKREPEIGILLLQFYDRNIDKCDNSEIMKTHDFIIKNQDLFIEPIKSLFINACSTLDIFNVLALLDDFSIESLKLLEDSMISLLTEKAFFTSFKIEVATLMMKCNTKYKSDIKESLLKHKNKLQIQIDSIEDFINGMK
ncbi:MAG: hypothetical protein Q8880_13330 [Bacteroidota bacterium]|nr:hypothetical protein [Bacteroidota bacterium]